MPTTPIDQATCGGTVADLLLTAIRRHPERSAFANAEATLSDRQLGEAIGAIARHFDSLDLVPGDSVALLGVNRWEVFAIAAAACLRGLRAVVLHALGSEADHAFILAAAGHPSPLMQLCLQDDQGQDVPQGERGEICVRGPLRRSGCLRRADDIAAALAGGWLHTGDIAWQDADGLLCIVDRRKDLVILGGFNVHPKEVEHVRCTHPAVAAATGIGVPDDKWGERVLACVQPKPGAVVAAAPLMELVRAAKGAVATPKRVEFLPARPLTALGQIDKKALRARHWPAGGRAVH